MILFALLNLYIFERLGYTRAEGGEEKRKRGEKREDEKNKLVCEGWIELHVILEEGHWFKMIGSVCYLGSY